MKRSLPVILLLFLWFQAELLVAQEMKRCGTTEYMARLKAEDPTLEARLEQNDLIIRNAIKAHVNSRTEDQVITIPVVFHILYNTTQQNISPARITDQIKVLNNDY